MGRGRAKAKQTKVARQLKYSSGGTDLERLRAELTSDGNGTSPANVVETEDDDEADPYPVENDEDGHPTA